VADPVFINGGRGRGAAGAEGVGWKGCRRGHAPFPEKNSILDLKLATLDAFWAYFFTVQLFGLNAKSIAFRLGKLAITSYKIN